MKQSLCHARNDNFRHVASKLFVIAVALFNASCDSGDIYPDKTIPEEDATGSEVTFARVQSDVFTAQCILCHGGSADAPAGNLQLTEGDSYRQLHNVAANSPTTTKKRIVPGDISRSFLVDVLENNVDPGFRYDHSKLSSLKSDDVLLIKRWILNGAEE
ncbi:MAG: hypothetical protein LBC40_05500 [Dysgonamonadaceae bacterium]|jgi:hypothetical protein|nr:hypothetical protein [Dysgonamonadaceae bacterium]